MSANEHTAMNFQPVIADGNLVSGFDPLKVPDLNTIRPQTQPVMQKTVVSQKIFEWPD